MDYLIRGSDRLKALGSDFRVVGRDAELNRLISILIRDRASSVILSGPGGVGSSTLAIGIQAVKGAFDAPIDITRKRMFWLDVDALFGIGDTEKINHAFHRLLDRLTTTEGSILVVEDARDLIEACRSNGVTHLINALLSAVEHRRTQIILEAKDEDLDALLRYHSDLREAFTLVPVAEPTGANLRAIIEHRAELLRAVHGIPISADGLDAAIEMTVRYPQAMHRAQPERAINLLDEALASYRIEAHRALLTDPIKREILASAQKLNDEQRQGEITLTRLEDQLDEITTRDAALSKARPDDARTSIFAGAIESPEITEIRSKITRVQSEIARISEAVSFTFAKINEGLALDRVAVLKTFSGISGISASRLDQNETEKLKGLGPYIHSRIFGQDEAVDRIVSGVQVMRIGRRSDAPLAYLCLGPSGVGKTEIAKALAAGMYDDESALVRFDMSEYMEKHAVAKLIGAPPGYEGFEAGGLLTNVARRNPQRVFLFDEIEKAHPDVFNVFLQVLSDGRLTDGLGRLATFGGGIAVFTTNIGQVHFLNEELSETEANAAAIEDLNQTYRAEFLNRFAGRQNIICFRRLDLPSIEKIVERELRAIANTYVSRGLTLHVADGVITSFCEDRFDARYGARGLPGFITATLEPKIVRAILDGKTSGTVDIGYDRTSRSFSAEIVT